MHSGGRWRSVCHRETLTPLVRRTNGTRHKATAAVRAHIFEFGFDAILAKRTLVRANASVGRLGRQIFVAILAVRPKLQCHRGLHRRVDWFDLSASRRKWS